MIDILLIVLIIMSSATIFGGYYMRFQAPKDKEMKYGLRTQRTQASMSAWEYANRTCGQCWLITGVIEILLGIPAVLMMYNFKGEKIAQALAFVYLVFFVIGLSSTVTSVIKETNSRFDENGRSIERE